MTSGARRTSSVHGLLNISSQLVPENGIVHVHVYPFEPWATQTPPLMHGFGEQASFWISQLKPVRSDGQMHS